VTARILTEISVGLTPEIQDALDTAVAFTGIKSSQLARIALTEKLCRDGFLKHPGQTRLEQKAAKSTPIKPPELNPAA
jgi:hypothetical protein